MRTVVTIASLCVAAVVAGCAGAYYPEGLDARIMAYDALEDRYRLMVERLSTVRELPHLLGELGTVVSGRRVVVDRDQLAQAVPLSVDEYTALVVRRAGHPVAVATLVQNGIHQPQDYEALALLSVYRHVERALTYLSALGVDRDRVGSLRLAWDTRRVEISGDGARTPRLADVGFDAPTRTIELYPDAHSPGVPAYLNEGAIGRAVAQAVIEALVFAGDGLARRASGRTSAIAMLDAGLWGTAVYLAADLVGDPFYLRHTDPARAQETDLTAERRFDDALVDDAGSVGWEPEPFGLLWAHALWSVREQVGSAVASDALVAALLLLGPRLRDAGYDQTFRAVSLPQLLVESFDASWAEQACTVFGQVYQGLRIEGCQ